MVAEGRKMPLGGSVLIDRARVYELIDQLRVGSSRPAEAFSGTEASEEEIDAIRRSETEARAQLARAEEEVTRLRRELDSRIGDQEVTRIAEERGRDMLVDANQRAEHLIREAEQQSAERLAQAARVAAEQMEEADGYALQLLQRLEEQIGLFLENVRSGIGQLQNRRGLDPTPPPYTHEPMTMPETGDDEDDDDSEYDEYRSQADHDAEDEAPQRRFPWLRD